MAPARSLRLIVRFPDQEPTNTRMSTNTSSITFLFRLLLQDQVSVEPFPAPGEQLVVDEHLRPVCAQAPDLAADNLLILFEEDIDCSIIQFPGAVAIKAFSPWVGVVLSIKTQEVAVGLRPPVLRDSPHRDDLPFRVGLVPDYQASGKGSLIVVLRLGRIHLPGPGCLRETVCCKEDNQ